MTILYRILGFIINLAAFFIVLALMFLVPASMAMPPLLFPVFVLVAVVLYCWFSTKFARLVLRQKEVVRSSLKDWIKVNGYVSIVFCFMSLPGTIALFKNSSAYIANMQEMTKQLGPQYQANFTTEKAMLVAVITTVYVIILFTHVLWTFALIKKHEEYFQ